MILYPEEIERLGVLLEEYVEETLMCREDRDLIDRLRDRLAKVPVDVAISI